MVWSRVLASLPNDVRHQKMAWNLERRLAPAPIIPFICPCLLRSTMVTRRPLTSAVQTAMVAFSTTPSPPLVTKRFNRHEIFSVDVDRQFAVVAELLQQLSVPQWPSLPPPKPHPNPSVAAKQKSTYAMMLSYDGRSFPGGFEFNPSFPPDNKTVQGTVTEHIKSVAGISHKLWVATAGRTDAKVSAKGALVSFATRGHITDNEKFIDDLNSCFSNEEMRIHGVQEVDSSFHASFATTAREYLYILPVLRGECDNSNHLQALADVSDTLLSAVVGEELDYLGISAGKVKTQTTLCKFQNAGCWYYGATKDEGSLQRKDEVVPGFENCWRSIIERGGERNEYSGCLVFKVKSNRFLRRMVRKLINSVLLDASDVLTHYPNDRLARKEEWEQKWRKRVENKDRGGNDAAPPVCAIDSCIVGLFCMYTFTHISLLLILTWAGSTYLFVFVAGTVLMARRCVVKS